MEEPNNAGTCPDEGALGHTELTLEMALELPIGAWSVEVSYTLQGKILDHIRETVLISRQGPSIALPKHDPEISQPDPSVALAHAVRMQDMQPSGQLALKRGSVSWMSPGVPGVDGAEY